MEAAHQITGRLVTLFRDDRLARLVVYVCVGLFLSLAVIAVSNEGLTRLGILLAAGTAVSYAIQRRWVEK